MNRSNTIEYRNQKLLYVFRQVLMFQMPRAPRTAQLNNKTHTQSIMKHEAANEITSFKVCPLSMSFKGMILLEVWKKKQQATSQFQFSHISLSQQKHQEEKRKKKQYLIRWQFACRKTQIISQTINNVLSQQNISKNSLFYRLKSLVKAEKERQSEKTVFQLANSKIDAYQQVQSLEVLSKPILKDAQINTAAILDDSHIYETKLKQEALVKKQNKAKGQEVKIKMRVKDSLIERIEAQMGRQFKKLDKIILKVNQIQNLTP